MVLDPGSRPRGAERSLNDRLCVFQAKSPLLEKWWSGPLDLCVCVVCVSLEKFRAIHNTAGSVHIGGV